MFASEAALASYTRSISQLAQQSRWLKASELLQELRQSGLRPRLLPFSAFLTACESSGRWDAVLSELQGLWARGVHH